MGPPEIEFVAGDGDEPPPPPAPSGPRLVRALLVAALIAGGLVFALSRQSGSRPVAAPVPSPSGSPSSGFVSAGPLIEPMPAPSVSVVCLAASGCHLTTADLAAIQSAVTSHLPRARLSSVDTSVQADHGYGNVGLKQRIIQAQIDSVNVLVRIRPYLKPEPAPTAGITPTPPGLGSAFFRYTTASYVIDVQWTGTDSTPPPITNLEALALDPRLEALG